MNGQRQSVTDGEREGEKQREWGEERERESIDWSTAATCFLAETTNVEQVWLLPLTGRQG